MLTGICQIARKGLLSQLKLDMVSNDLANVGTFGYKRNGVVFSLSLPKEAEGEVPDYGLPPYGLKTFIDFTQGPYRQTGNPLDLAIKGNGFFVVSSREGNLYTRRGDFQLDAQGRIVTQDGRPLLGEGGPITVTGEEIHVDEEGNVYSGQEPLGKLRIVRFDDPNILEKVEGSYFRPRDPTLADIEKPAEGVEIWSGYLELSNVNVVYSMVEMLSILRGFEAYKNVMQALREADLKSAEEVGLIR